MVLRINVNENLKKISNLELWFPFNVKTKSLPLMLFLSLGESSFHLGNAQINLVFRLAYTTFVFSKTHCMI